MDNISHLDKSEYVIKPKYKEIKEYLDKYLLDFIDQHPELKLLSFEREVCNDYSWYVDFKATYTANIERYEVTKILNIKCSKGSDDGDIDDFLPEGFERSEYFIIDDKCTISVCKKCKSCVCIKNKWYIIDSTDEINEFDDIAIKNGIEDKDNGIISEYFKYRLQEQKAKHEIFRTLQYHTHKNDFNLQLKENNVKKRQEYNDGIKLTVLYTLGLVGVVTTTIIHLANNK